MISFEKMPPEAAKKIRYILHDIDDTITNEGKLTAEAYSALWKLHDAGLKVIPVTGRPAGWCDMVIREWPVDAIVGETEPSFIIGKMGSRRPSGTRLFLRRTFQRSWKR